MSSSNTSAWLDSKILRVAVIVTGALLVVGPFGPRPYLRVPHEPIARLEPGAESHSFATQNAHADAAEAAIAAFDAEVLPQLKNPGCHSRLRWAHGDRRKTRLVLVYLHGFSACPLDVHPTMDAVAKSLDANLIQIRLRGHGLPPPGLDQATASQWLTDVARARGVGLLAGDQTVMVGMSTGATLALLSASASHERMAGLVLLSPNLGVANKAAEILTLPWGVPLARVITGGARHSWEPENDLRREMWTTDYSLDVAAQMQLVVDHARRLDFSSWTLPVLTVVSTEDRVVDLDQVHDAMERLGSSKKQLVVLPGSNRHELAGFAIAESLVEPLAQTIREFLLEL